MKSPKHKTREKEISEVSRKAKVAEPENQTSAKDAKNVPVNKTKAGIRSEKL
ncbi:hypothetical protein OQX61_06780 [Pedobacter sp. PLR]|uniref:hypothetical protein n=1 Tax=Pedobacter sp. PLR TaxID=2994465 RepID=UPI002246F32B|nr:hypothetical protein [Pedobacter sp. PLR]MCX2450973.1 hypothetical protein [Pedobacter sp. PLR]